MKKTLTLALLLSGMALAQPSHPLDPLTGPEIEETVKVLRDAGKLNESSRFPILNLCEPPKSVGWNWQEGQPLPRKAFAVVLDRKNDKVFEAIVDLNSHQVASWKEKPGVHPGVLIEEFEQPTEFVRKDPRWQEAMRKRGIEDFENVQIDVWATGLLSPSDRKTGKRYLRCMSFYRPKGASNPYYRPIEGVIVVVDPKTRSVVRVEDTGVITPVDKTPNLGDLSPEAVSATIGLRPPLKPIVCTQPSGSNIVLRGHEVEWDHWKFRFGMHPREGAVLYDVRFDGRPVMYRGALSEMVVPYGDNAPNWYWRNAFDLGEYGVGRLANGLRKGYEIPSYAMLLDSQFCDDMGKPYVEKDNVALYERELGFLWKHRDFETNTDQTRPARYLYLTTVATVGNYDYGLSWVFAQDGSFSCEAGLTGIVLSKGVNATSSNGNMDAVGVEQFGRLVDKNVVAPNHQHFFNFRLDMDVDGPQNSLVELNNQALAPGKDNPVGNAFMRRITPLADEKAAQRDVNLYSQRSWLVVNRNKRNALGQPTAYQIMPMENSVPYLHPNAPIYKRAGFLQHHMWGTRYHPEEIYASGDYPNQSVVSTGLPGYSKNNESLQNQDVVMWYTFGVTHNPRPEEWPIMPIHKTGFKLVPNGFFARTPCLDVPPPAK